MEENQKSPFRNQLHASPKHKQRKTGNLTAGELVSIKECQQNHQFSKYFTYAHFPLCGRTLAPCTGQKCASVSPEISPICNCFHLYWQFTLL